MYSTCMLCGTGEAGGDQRCTGAAQLDAGNEIDAAKPETARNQKPALVSRPLLHVNVHAHVYDCFCVQKPSI